MEICENYNKEGTPVFMAGIFSTYDGNGEMKDGKSYTRARDTIEDYYSDRHFQLGMS